MNEAPIRIILSMKELIDLWIGKEVITVDDEAGEIHIEVEKDE